MKHEKLRFYNEMEEYIAEVQSHYFIKSSLKFCIINEIYHMDTHPHINGSLRARKVQRG